MRANDSDQNRLMDVISLFIAILLFIGVKILFWWTIIVIVTIIGGLL